MKEITTNTFISILIQSNIYLQYIYNIIYYRHIHYTDLQSIIYITYWHFISMQNLKIEHHLHLMASGMIFCCAVPLGSEKKPNKTFNDHAKRPNLHAIL